MIALVKLLLTAVAIGGAAAGVRALVKRGRAVRRAEAPAKGADAVEMSLCPVCQIYVTSACQRPDCPLA